MELVLRRKIAPSIIEIIAPSGLLVLVAWVLLSVLIISKLDKITFQNLSVYFQISFLLPVDLVPGRMGFLLTLFLCTVNILNSMATSTPKSGGVTTAIIQWILWCLMFIIIPILEYAIILCYKKYKRPAMNIGENISVNSGQFQEGKVEEISRKLDKWMMIAYPCSFIILTAIFWSTII